MVYERLIDRLGLALDVARTAVRLRDERPTELELRGLSPAEYKLISAYLNASGAESPPLAASAVPADPVLTTNVVWLSDQPRKSGACKARIKR